MNKYIYSKLKEINSYEEVHILNKDIRDTIFLMLVFSAFSIMFAFKYSIPIQIIYTVYALLISIILFGCYIHIKRNNKESLFTLFKGTAFFVTSLVTSIGFLIPTHMRLGFGLSLVVAIFIFEYTIATVLFLRDYKRIITRSDINGTENSKIASIGRTFGALGIIFSYLIIGISGRNSDTIYYVLLFSSAFLSINFGIIGIFNIRLAVDLFRYRKKYD